MTKEFSIEPRKASEMLTITTADQRTVLASGVKGGLAVVFVPHTTAGVTINEGADPAVRKDIIETLSQIVPWERVYGHAEGNSPAHIKTSLIGSSVTIMVEDARLQLGQWQSIFLCEFDGPRKRRVMVKITEC